MMCIQGCVLSLQVIGAIEMQSMRRFILAECWYEEVNMLELESSVWNGYQNFSLSVLLISP